MLINPDCHLSAEDGFSGALRIVEVPCSEVAPRRTRYLRHGCPSTIDRNIWILCRFFILPFQDNSSAPTEEALLRLCSLKSVAFAAIRYYQRPIFRYTFGISRQDFFRSLRIMSKGLVSSHSLAFIRSTLLASPSPFFLFFYCINADDNKELRRLCAKRATVHTS